MIMNHVIQYYLPNHTQNVISGRNKCIKNLVWGSQHTEWRVLYNKHLAIVAIRAKPNGRYIEVAVLQRAGIAVLQN